MRRQTCAVQHEAWMCGTSSTMSHDIAASCNKRQQTLQQSGYIPYDIKKIFFRVAGLG